MLSLPYQFIIVPEHIDGAAVPPCFPLVDKPLSARCHRRAVACDRRAPERRVRQLPLRAPDLHGRKPPLMCSAALVILQWPMSLTCSASRDGGSRLCMGTDA